MTEQTPQPNSSDGDWLPPIPWAVLRAKCFTPVQGRVLFVLWSRCNRSGDCYSSFKVLGDDSGCDTRTANIAVATMEQHGVIDVDRPSGKASRFHLDPAVIAAFIECHDTPLINVGGTGHKTHPKNVGGTKLTPLIIEGTTPLNFVVTPPSFLGGEEEPLEEEPLKNSPGSSVPSVLSEPSEPSVKIARAPKPAGKKRQTEPPLSPDLQAVCDLWVSLGLGPVSQNGRSGLRLLVAEHGREWAETGLRRASEQNIRSPVSWLRVCIPGWKREEAANQNGAGPPGAVPAVPNRVMSEFEAWAKGGKPP